MTPTLTVIMPTANRRAFVPDAIAAFLVQGRDDAELLILDDGSDSVGDLVPRDPRIRYIRADVRVPLGAKRNRLCELARGDVIVHWDDDDWHAPDRLARQIAALQANGADICGCTRLIFLAADGSAAWDYTYGGDRPWVAGNTLCYRRDYWRHHPFPEVSSGEDTQWIYAAPRERIFVMPDNDFLIARVHPGNASPKRTNGVWWRPRDPAGVLALMVGGAPAMRGAAVGPAEVTPVANVYACLVHEHPECVLDLVRNLRTVDPVSPILLYDGSPHGGLLDPRMPWQLWGCERVANPRPMRWGALHGFALDCIAHLGSRDFETLTIVDSDQLAVRPGYAAFLAARFPDRSGLGVLSKSPGLQTLATGAQPAKAALAEQALWQPFLARFANGRETFVHWTFWPGTVIFAEAARAILDLFGDSQLQHILSLSKLWATEEVLFPTLAALLGFRITANPCRQDWVQYRRPYSRQEVAAALVAPDAFWLHPAPRRLDDPVRAQIRTALGGYRSAASSRSPAPPFTGQLWTTIAAMHAIEGWLADEEAELLLLAAREALSRPDAAKRIVEVGAFCGKATVGLATIARSLGGDVVVIDSFDGIVGARDAKLEDHGSTRAKFDATIREHGLTDAVEVHVRASTLKTPEGPFDIAVIDGLHDYASVREDFMTVEPHLAIGARAAFHDYADYFPGVVAFVDELLAQGAWTEEARAGTMVLLRRTA